MQAAGEAVSWTGEGFTRPLRNDDFRLMLEWLGFQPDGAEYINATRLRSAFRSESQKVQTQIGKSIRCDDLERLKQDSHITLPSPVQGEPGLTAARVLAVSPYDVIKQRHEVRVLRRDDSGRWLSDDVDRRQDKARRSGAMNGVRARQVVEDAVWRELVGPLDGAAPEGKPLDCSTGKVAFATRGEVLRPLLRRDDEGRGHPPGQAPAPVWGRGALPPGDDRAADGGGEKQNEDLGGVTSISTEPDDIVQQDVAVGEVEVESAKPVRGALDDDLDLSDANGFKPSAMAISFECRLSGADSLEVSVSGAQYTKIAARIPQKDKTKAPREEEWWLRKPFQGSASLHGQDLLGRTRRLQQAEITYEGDGPTGKPSLEVFSRPVPGRDDPSLRIVTVALVNRSVGVGDANAIFQAGFTVTAAGQAILVAYHEAERKDRDDEEQSLDLLYRNQRTYAVGHGCAARWDQDDAETPKWVATDAMPAYEVESLTPDIFTTDESGQRVPVTVSMRDLALGTKEGVQQVEQVLRLYGEWITKQKALIPGLPARMHAAADRHMKEADRALGRMHEGWKIVKANPKVAQAFRWANEAMLFQQIRSSLPLRELKEHGRGKSTYTAPEGDHPRIGTLKHVQVPERKGSWRPFQIAFILASLPELTNPVHANRTLVDLIFFPTGGGKTEAYLGAAAVSLLARRLRARTTLEPTRSCGTRCGC